MSDLLAVLRLGDMRAVLAAMEPKSVHLVVTSPPFFAKRKYANADEQQATWGGDTEGCEHEWGQPLVHEEKRYDFGTSTLSGSNADQMAEMTWRTEGAFCARCGAWRGALGHEPTPDSFVAHLVECFAAVKRVLRDDGVLVVEINDSYAGADIQRGQQSGKRGRALSDSTTCDSASESPYGECEGNLASHNSGSDGRLAQEHPSSSEQSSHFRKGQQPGRPESSHLASQDDHTLDATLGLSPSLPSVGGVALDVQESTNHAPSGLSLGESWGLVADSSDISAFHSEPSSVRLSKDEEDVGASVPPVPGETSQSELLSRQSNDGSVSTGGASADRKEDKASDSASYQYHTPTPHHSQIPAQTRIGIPERFALAMAADGWRWRDSLIWRHTSAMPESVSGWSWQRCKVKVKSGPMAGIGHPSHLPGGQGELNVPLNENPHRAQWADCPGCPKCAPNGGYVLRRGQWRATVAHSYVYVFSKTAAYYGDGEAVLTVNKGEYIVSSWEERKAAGDMSGNREIEGFDRGSDGRPKTRDMGNPAGANLRSVLDIGPEPFTLELCAACRHVYDRRHYARLAKRDGKRVCSCGSTEWVSHYATFPTKLPELFIRAFTSEAGCCPKCQAPHARMIEAMETNARGYSHHDDAMAFGSRMTGIPTEGYIPGKTIGWRPTCSHGDLAPIPCTVLDCFAGTGSTLVAAQRNGRSYIGIDCSQDYLDMAAARLAETQAALV